jgi:iron complex outermembrane receptor protein
MPQKRQMQQRLSRSGLFKSWVVRSNATLIKKSNITLQRGIFMHFSKHKLRSGAYRSLRTSSNLLVVSALLAMANQLMAQETESEAELEEVVVTGSLLATGRGSTSPVDVIGGESLIENPRPNLSGFFAANVPQHQLEDSNQSNTFRENRTRVQGVSLRGLGAHNTLTLIDGQRTVDYAESISTGWRFVAIDQAIPGIALKRMELLLDGGSAIYGTDAVAGVVNLIPDYGFEGVKVNLSTQRYPDAGSSGNDVGSVLIGTATDRTNWLTAVEWQKWDHLLQSDLGLFDPADAPVGGIAQYREFAPGTGVGGLGGAAAGKRLADPLCGTMGYRSGALVQSAGGPACQNTSWASGAGGNNQIVRQGNRNSFTFFTGVEHQFSDKLSVKLSAGYNSTGNNNPVDGVTTAINTSPSTNPAIGMQIPIPRTNPGVVENARLDSNWSNAGTNNGFFLTPMNLVNPWDVLDNDINSTNRRISGSVTYELNDVWSLNYNGTVSQSEVNRYDRSLVADRLRKALAGLGGPNCQGTVAAANGCEYFNPFLNSSRAGLGNSQGLLEWIQPPRHTRIWGELTVNQLVLTGDSSGLFELPAGPVGVAVGYENRIDSWYTDHDPLANTGGYQPQAGGISADFPLPFGSTGRSNVVDALFMELAIPVTDRLDVQAAVRSEDYSEASDFSTTNPKIGFNWSVNDSLTVRGSWGTSFKAPTVEHTQQPTNLSTTFLTLGEVGRNSVNGPCPAPAGVATGCFIAGGIGNTRTDILLQTAPNPQLQPVESTNWSVGFDWDITEDLSLGMSYVDIQFENVIRNLRPYDQLLELSECAIFSPDGLFPADYPIASLRGQDVYTAWGGLATFPGNPAGYRFPMYLPRQGNGGQCFELDAQGRATKGYQVPINVAEQHVKSVDVNLSYTLDTAWGQFNVSPNAAILLEWKEQASPTRPAIDFVGFRPTFGGGYQEYRVNMPIRWTRDDHTVILTPRYLSKLDNFLSGLPEDDFIYFDMNYLWQVNDEMRLSVFANNVFDQFPTMHQIANFGSGMFPRDGRLVGASFEMSFSF